MFISTCKIISAQEPDDIEQFVESQAEIGEENYDFSELGETLNYYKEHPINLNSASKDQLKQLFFLTPQHIDALISHRDSNGSFLDILELQSISEINAETLEKILPYVTIKPRTTFSKLSVKELFTRGQHDLMVRFGRVLEEQRGYQLPDTAGKGRGYVGSSDRLLTRYRYHFEDKLIIGATMEKDAGEAFFQGAQKYGFDFYSGFISFQGSSAIRKLIVGDYALQFGQGLTMWSGLGFGKGGGMTTVTKNEIGLRPHSSANETLFLRGAAATIGINKINVTPFVSYRYLDASLNSQNMAFSSINESGFHRTDSELGSKNTVTQFIYGSSVSYDRKNLKIGSILYRAEFNKPFEIGDSEYRRFNFEGSSLTNTGIFYNYNWRNAYFFGEISHSIHSGTAYLSGLIASLTKQVSLAAVYRNYERDYHSFFSQALSESPSAVNEKGFYTGLVISPDSKSEISIYSDVFSFPWLKYRVDAPSKGVEIFAQFTYSPNKKLKFLVRYKSENKEENSDIENTFNFLESIQKRNYRAEVTYKITDSFQLRNRMEMVSYQKGQLRREVGYLVYQDLIYNPLNSKLSGNARFAIFDTDGFNSRVYAYERDVLYSYSLPGLQNRGIRFYLNGRYKVKRGLDIWLRYAITKYTNLDEIGSGLDLIEGDQKSDLKAQIRIQF